MFKRIFLFVLPLVLWSVPYAPLRAPWLPFVSGDAFRAYCDYVLDEEDSSLDPLVVKPRSTIFVKTDYLGYFFLKVHPRIQYPYILVTHNSDYSVPSGYLSYLSDDKIIAWFGQNVDDNSSPKMHPIPIGIANRYWDHGNGQILQEVQAQNAPRENVLYLNFAIDTFPQERRRVYSLLASAPFSYRSPIKKFKGYLQDLASCKFVASPRGNGLDTHRLWESLYLGSYPIVKNSTLDPLYSDLPIIIVNDWEEVTQEFLEKKEREFKENPPPIDKLYMDYWIRLIDSYRDGVKR
jgi:hypothetical protein